jgi:hypothetical protein
MTNAHNGTLQTVLPSLIALMVGLAASYVGVQTALARYEVQIESIDRTLNNIEDRLDSHMQADGHPTLLERVKGLQNRMDD